MAAFAVGRASAEQNPRRDRTGTKGCSRYFDFRIPYFTIHSLRSSIFCHYLYRHFVPQNLTKTERNFRIFSKNHFKTLKKHE